jgi:ankyrin repeat protein
MIAPETIRDFVIAAHSNLDRVRLMLGSEPGLRDLAYRWSDTDQETALQAASHVGYREIAEYLLAQGATHHITTAAMLGQRDRVDHYLEHNPESIKAVGAHGISLLAHAVLSGDPALVKHLIAAGATSGSSLALTHAAARGHLEIVRDLLASTDPDRTWRNHQGLTAAELAAQAGYGQIAALLAVNDMG